MTDESTQATTFTLDDISLGGGVTQSDRQLMEETLHQVVTRLAAMKAGVEAQLSIKDRGSSDPKTTLEVWVQGLPRLVATSDQMEPRDAFNEVGANIVKQVNVASERREPRNNRQKRGTIRN